MSKNKPKRSAGNYVLPTVAVLSVVGVAAYAARDRIYQLLSKIEVSLKGIDSFKLDWQESSIRPVLSIKNGNSHTIIITAVEGRLDYQKEGEEIDARFKYEDIKLVMEPNKTVNATFSITFDNQAPFEILADMVEKRKPLPISGTVTAQVKEGKTLTLPFSYSL